MLKVGPRIGCPENSRESHQSEDLNVDERIILKFTLEDDGRMLVEFVWLLIWARKLVNT
jgi:hypothetical protein